MNSRSQILGLTMFFVTIAMATGCGDSAEGGRGDESYGFTTGPLMLPGENCLRCHSSGSAYPDAPHWTAAGTVFSRADADDASAVAGANVVITDRTGHKVTLVTNAAGNFYTAEPLQTPYRVALEHDGARADMPIEAPAGACNACHSYPDPTGGTKGRIRIPSAPVP